MKIFNKNPVFYSVIILWIIAAIFAFIKINFYIEESNGDLPEYLYTARFISGETIEVFPQRLIKPLQPLITAFLNLFTNDFKLAFEIQNWIFYILLVPATFLLFKEFFNNKIYPAFIGTVLFIGGYPMLRTGMALYIETGAWFFYILGLYTTLKFMKDPSARWLWINTIIITIGFFYREYSILNWIILNTIILFALEIPKQEKKKYLLIFNSIFLSLHLAWQVIIYWWFDFNFKDWFVRGQSTGPALDRWWYIKRSFFALLIGGWVFVPAAILRFKDLLKTEKIFLFLTLITPMIVLIWGAVLSRLYYVLAPGLIILVVLGLERLVPNRALSALCVVSMIILNYFFLAKGALYVY